MAGLTAGMLHDDAPTDPVLILTPASPFEEVTRAVFRPASEGNVTLPACFEDGAATRTLPKEWECLFCSGDGGVRSLRNSDGLLGAPVRRPRSSSIADGAAGAGGRRAPPATDPLRGGLTGGSTAGDAGLEGRLHSLASRAS